MLPPKQTNYHHPKLITHGKRMCGHALTSPQVGEIEEQLTSARRELARSEEANQKLQRDVKEVRRPALSTDHKPPLRVSVMDALSLFCSYSQRRVTVCYGNRAVCLLCSSSCYCTHKSLYPVAMVTVPSVELQAFSHGCGSVNQSMCWQLIGSILGREFLSSLSEPFPLCAHLLRPNRCSFIFPPLPLSDMLLPLKSVNNNKLPDTIILQLTAGQAQ